MDFSSRHLLNRMNQRKPYFALKVRERTASGREKSRQKANPIFWQKAKAAYHTSLFIGLLEKWIWSFYGSIGISHFYLSPQKGGMQTNFPILEK
ncbi:MAG: hypothetical protein HY730_10240 [Candidatus Tectomicrobia bacterium]|uniref:Uncharacterized protein n=1 Tax=Tectimicrobiota bacterium TaxID=2528274 RepID=A0A933GMN5_UNCTE|nr:hypothetical protein [Candidatus Tectomicrobia bacterium]